MFTLNTHSVVVSVLTWAELKSYASPEQHHDPFTFQALMPNPRSLVTGAPLPLLYPGGTTNPSVAGFVEPECSAMIVAPAGELARKKSAQSAPMEDKHRVSFIVAIASVKSCKWSLHFDMRRTAELMPKKQRNLRYSL
jgi:hypothetical protein